MTLFEVQSAQADDRLWSLTAALCDGSISADDLERLEAMLRRDEGARLFFATYMDLHGRLLWRFRGGEQEEGREERGEGRGMAGSRTISASVGAAVELPRQLNVEQPLHPESRIPSLESLLPFSPLSPLPSLSTNHYPLSTNFVGGPVFSYMVATLILGMMLLSAWAYKISRYDRDSVVDNSRGQTAPGVLKTTPELVFVGRVTGMKDCRWSDPRTQTVIGASVPLKRKYALTSGLLEITYTTGARVILEGPCTYEIESDAGGYLALGKLTALVEKRGRVGDGETGRKPRSPLLPSSPSPRLFSVRTPTAVVTDLGTEFGVEVGADGNTTSHVFRGSVELRVIEEKRPAAASAGVETGRAIQLIAGESARVEKGKDDARLKLIVGEKAGRTPKFVRRMVELPKQLDLLDVVAGGNGTGRGRGRGIDPVTGERHFVFFGKEFIGDNRYRTVSWHGLIDGVFIPDGRGGGVQTDSAGHAFDGFPATSGKTYGSIWVRAANNQAEQFENLPLGPPDDWTIAIGDGLRYMPEKRGLLAFHSNSGVTFDLGAMRDMYPAARPGRFRATVGMIDVRSINPKADGLADLWVLVDGRLKLKREQVRVEDGAFKADVELGSNDRFLTIAATDGGNGYSCDCLVFGDPVVEMTEIQDGNAKEDRSMKD